MPTALFCDPAMIGRPRARLPHARVEAEVAHQLLRLLEASHVADRGLPIPTKPPVYNGMIAPRDSWMMPPPL